MNDSIHISRVEFLLTKRCNANCEHCSVPINSDLTETSYRDIEAVKKCYTYINENYPLTSTMIYGGEPLLFIDYVVELLEIASKYEVPSIDLITSGFISNKASKDLIYDAVDKLSSSGVKRILLSVDAFHQERIPIEYVEIFLEYILQLQFCEILLHPAWLVSKEDNNSYNLRTREILNDLSHKYSVGISSGNFIIPSGNNKKNIGNYYETKAIQLDKKCGEIPYTNSLDKITSIRLLPDGNVNICRGMTIGNIFDRSIEEILENYSPKNTLTSSLLFTRGVKGLYELAMDYETDINPNDYYGICDLCTDLIHFFKERGIF